MGGSVTRWTFWPHVCPGCLHVCTTWARCSLWKIWPHRSHPDGKKDWLFIHTLGFLRSKVKICYKTKNCHGQHLSTEPSINRDPENQSQQSSKLIWLFSLTTWNIFLSAAQRVNTGPQNIKKSVCLLKLHQSTNSEKSGFIFTDVEIGNQVKDSEQKDRCSVEDGMETGSIEALIILVMKWTRNIFMTSFFKVPEAVRIEPASKGRKVNQKAQN